MALTYTRYLKIDELLALQQPLSGGEAHDEMLFIVTHQAYELWFKEALYELDRLRKQLEAPDLARAQLTLRRLGAINKVLIAQVEVLETMLPQGFLAFRGLLGTASGFQSVQFREIEFILGHKRAGIGSFLPEDSEAKRRLKKRYREPTIWDGFLLGLARSGYTVPSELLERDVTQPITPSPAAQRILLELYSDSPGMVCLCEMLLDFDEGFQDWRYRHIKMVERMIGEKHGTGGSEGVEYLKTTLFKPFFPDLWAIRSKFREP